MEIAVSLVYWQYIFLLKAGLLPLVIETSQRREYIECLAGYQAQIEQLTNTTGVWPNDPLLKPFVIFCQQSYAATQKLMIETLISH